MIDRNDFLNAATHLFARFDEIKISSSKYSSSSIQILNFLNKKCRQNDLRNLKSLYKLWINDTVSVIPIKTKFKNEKNFSS